MRKGWKVYRDPHNEVSRTEAGFDRWALKIRCEMQVVAVGAKV